MLFFKSKAEKELDDIIQSMAMNMANNYKDNAQANLKELEDTLEQMKSEGVLKEKTCIKYADILSTYQIKLRGYSHKDQKPYWT